MFQVSGQSAEAIYRLEKWSKLSNTVLWPRNYPLQCCQLSALTIYEVIICIVLPATMNDTRYFDEVRAQSNDFQIEIEAIFCYSNVTIRQIFHSLLKLDRYLLRMQITPECLHSFPQMRGQVHMHQTIKGSLRILTYKWKLMATLRLESLNNVHFEVGYPVIPTCPENQIRRNQTHWLGKLCT